MAYPFTVKLTVILCLSWPIVLIGTVVDHDRSAVVSLGISTQIGVSSMFAILLREKLNVSL